MISRKASGRRRPLQATTGLLLFGLAAAACGGSDSAEGGEGETVKFTLAHIATPEAHLAKGMEAFGEALEEELPGRVEFQHAHSGQLGDEAEALSAVQTGTLEAAAVVNSVLVNARPELAILDLPYLWRSNEHFGRAIDSEPIRELYDDPEENGNFRWLGQWPSGQRSIFGKSAVQGVEDLEGVKLRVLPSPVFIDTFEAMGAVPTPVDWLEVYNALDLGTVDLAETAINAMVDANLHEVSEHFSFTEHAYTSYAVVVNEKWWSSLDSADQEAFQEALAHGQEVSTGALDEEVDRAVQTLEETGVELSRPDQAEFREIAQTQYPDSVPSDLIDEMNALADE